MASSRLERIGNIYTRVRGLLRSGAMKPEDKPVWYDVYEAFPPKIEPQYGRKAPETTIRNIMYPEDIIRAEFYKRFGSPGLMSISETNQYLTPCQKFVNKYKEMEKDFSDKNELFEAVVKTLDEEKLLAEEGTPDQPTSSGSMASMFSSTVQNRPSKFSVGEVLTEK